MSQTRRHLSLVVDEVLAEAKTAAQRRVDEAHAIKVAEAQPRTEVGRNLRTLAADLRSDTDHVTYDDLSRSA